MPASYNNNSKVGIQAQNVVNSPITQHLYNSPNPRCETTTEDKITNINWSASSSFVGRDDLLDRLDKCLCPPQSTQSPRPVFVLYGLGGLGKTQVALKFAEIHRERFSGTFWVDATNAESWQQSYVDIANQRRLIQNQDGPTQDFTVGKAWLAGMKSWLLIIDNADDTSMDVSGIFPGGTYGSIMITTRNPECRAHATPSEMYHKLATLDLHQSIQLLVKKAGRDTPGSEETKHAGRIVEALQHLPLAIAQAGAAIRENEMKFTEYLDMLEENPRDLLSNRPRQGRDSYQHTTNTTWEVSLNMMAEKRPAELVDAQSILNALGYFYHVGVPVIILEHFLKYKSQDRSDTIKTIWHTITSFLSNSASTIRSSNLDTRVRVKQALHLLSRYSLIERDNERGEVSVHGLVHSWIRGRMYKSNQTKAQMQALSALRAYVGNGNSITDYKLRRTVYPHIRSFIECVDRQELPCPFVGSEQTMENFAWIAFESGNFKLSQRLYLGYFHHLKTKLGTRDAQTLTVMHELSRVYERQGLYEEAKKWAESAFILGGDSTTALVSKARLAVALAGKGDYERSRQANEFVLDSLERTTGDEKQLLEVEVKKNLAYVLQRQGKYDEAAQLAKEALLATKNLLGEDHPETLEVLSNLALIMEKLDKWEDAERLTKEAWRKKEKSLGKDHPETITSRARLGVILTQQGHYRDAEEILRETLELRKCILGKEHPDTITSFSQLGEVLFHQGKYEKAEKKLRKALQGFRDHMDQHHDNIRMSEINLGVCLRRQKQYQESEKLHRQSLTKYDLKFGTDHPDTMNARDSFVAVLLAQKKRAEAEGVAKDLVTHSERRFGRNGAETLKRIDSLGWIKVALRKELDEAEALIREAVEGLTDKLGKASPDTLTATYHLAYVFRRRQKYDDSWLMYQRACQGMRGQGLKGEECFEGFEKLKREMEQKGIKREIDDEEGLPPTKRQKR